MQAYYGKEPFDLRLTLLRLIREWKLILFITAAGTLVFGGGYFVKNVLFAGQKQYSVKSTYRVEFNVDKDEDVSKVYINAASWDSYVHTEEFLNAVQSRLEEIRRYMDSMTLDLSNEDLGKCLQGGLDTDLRMPSTTVTFWSPQLCVTIARAVEEAMTEDFPQGISEIRSIRVIDPAREAKEALSGARPVRAVILSGILSCFFAVVLFLLRELTDDSIWLPASVGKRYGLKVLGTVESPEFAENVSYLLGGKRVVVCPVQESIDPAKVEAVLKESAALGKQTAPEENASSDENSSEKICWIPIPALPLNSEDCRTLREAEGILAVVEAGRHAGRRLEYMMEFLRQQDCEITAVLLWNADEKLISRYYGLGRR